LNTTREEMQINNIAIANGSGDDGIYCMIHYGPKSEESKKPIKDR
jgi:hypothetical protein